MDQNTISTMIGLNVLSVKPLSTREGMSYQLKTDQGNYLLKCVDKQSQESYALHRQETLRKEVARCPSAKSGESKRFYWLLREWIEGETATEHCSYIRNDLSPETKRRFVTDIIQMLSSVMRLHALGYLHGDLQPSHFLFDHRNQVHLIDLETTVKINAEKTEYAGALVHYVSPEVATGMLQGEKHIPLDIASETYAFGAVVFYLSTGLTVCNYGDNSTFEEMLQAIVAGHKRPFHASFSELEPVISKCLARNPRDRYSTLEDLENDFRNLLEIHI